MSRELDPNEIKTKDCEAYQTAYQQILSDIDAVKKEAEKANKRYQSMQLAMMGLSRLLGVEAPAEHDYTNPNYPTHRNSKLLVITRNRG